MHRASSGKGKTMTLTPYYTAHELNYHSELNDCIVT